MPVDVCVSGLVGWLVGWSVGWLVHEWKRVLVLFGELIQGISS